MANPTTNYGFVLPTATDLVTDLPADFDVALQGVDTRLKALQPGTTLGDLAYSSATANTNTRLGVGTNGQVLTVASGVPSWATPTAGMTNPMTTTGDTIYSSSGSTPARLGIGTTGQILKVVDGLPAWAAAPAASPVIQVKNATYSTTTTVGSNGSWVDTGLTISITPTLSSSKVLVFVSINGIYKSAANADNRLGLRLLKNSTAIHNIEGTAGRSGDARTLAVGGVSANYLDSPATTSATTYKVQMINWNDSEQVTINMVSDATGSPTRPALESCSSITVMEIGV
jgi:hypothetical protein